METITSLAQNRLLKNTLKTIFEWNSHTIEFSINQGSNGVRDLYRTKAKQALDRVSGDLESLSYEDQSLIGMLRTYCSFSGKSVGYQEGATMEAAADRIEELEHALAQALTLSERPGRVADGSRPDIAYRIKETL